MKSLGVKNGMRFKLQKEESEEEEKKKKEKNIEKGKRIKGQDFKR